MLFTNEPGLILRADSAGIDRIVIDIERRGKRERQTGYHLEINQDTLDDLRLFEKTTIGRTLRLNMLHPGTKLEIEKALEYGVDWFILPMVRSADEVHSFVEIVGQRAGTIALVETLSGLVNLKEINAVKDLDEIYIGLNDLSLEAGWTFGYRFLSEGILDFFLTQCSKPFGFGGITILGKGKPLPTESILKEQARLGATSVILRRAFRRDIQDRDLKTEVRRVREFYRQCKLRDATEVERDRKTVHRHIEQIFQKRLSDR